MTGVIIAKRDDCRDIWRRMFEPMALPGRKQDERRQSACGQHGAVFRQSSQTQADADKEPKSPGRGLVVARLRKEHPARRPRRDREPKQQRAVRNDPTSGGGEEEGRNVQGEKRDQSRPSAEQTARESIGDPTRRHEEDDKGRASDDVFASCERGEMRDPQMQRRMVEIGKGEAARNRDRVAFIDA